MEAQCSPAGQKKWTRGGKPKAPESYVKRFTTNARKGKKWKGRLEKEVLGGQGPQNFSSLLIEANTNELSRELKVARNALIGT